MDRREVDGVEAHPRDTVELGGRGGERTVHRTSLLVDSTCRPGEELVPGAEQRLRAFDLDLAGDAAGQQFAEGMVVQQIDEVRLEGGGHGLGRGDVLPAETVGHGREFGAPLLRCPLRGTEEQARTGLEVVRQLRAGLTGVDLGGDRVPPGGDRVRPDVDAEGPHTRDVRDDDGVDLVLVVRAGVHRDSDGAPEPGGGLGTPDVEGGGEGVVSLAPGQT